LYEKLDIATISFKRYGGPDLNMRYTRFGSAYAAQAAKNLSELFRMPVSVSLGASPADGSNPVATGSRFDSVVALDDLRETAILSLDCNLVFAWVDRLSGGTGADPFPARALTDFENAILEFPLLALLSALPVASAAGESVKAKLRDGATYVDYGEGEVPEASRAFVSLAIESRGMSGSFFLELSEDALAIFTGTKGFVPDVAPSAIESGDDRASILHELESLSGRIGALENRIGDCLSRPELASVDQVIAKLREIDAAVLVQEVQRMLISEPIEDRHRIAILLILLGIEKSVEIFNLLRRDEILSMTFAIARCEFLEDSDIAETVRAFSGLADGRVPRSGGIDYARDILEKSIGSAAAIEIINELTDSLSVRPFDFIGSADPDRVISLLSGESPQFIAMLLSFLGGRNAAVILDALPDDVTVTVTKKIMSMGPTLPAVVRAIEKTMESKLGDSKYGDFMVSGGPESAVEILSLASKATEDAIMARLDAESSEIAALIREKMFVFEDIVLLGDQAARATFLECNPADLVLASWTLAESVRAFIRDHLSDEAAKEYAAALESGSSAELSDVDAARHRIVDVIRKLEGEGSITVGE
jgi:flagellar motor switch protein FliG